ncbi:pol II transcription elongation factor [Rhodotorula toruloides]|uniref:Pol II transcription elongation factor n=1 Tax=Rhodotorula toruloides TaxID=5286 RepID=A0A511KF49_RHOTO|nr:pol II transcription elongation factor [Rhodotorula toruloides]
MDANFDDANVNGAAGAGQASAAFEVPLASSNEVIPVSLDDVFSAESEDKVHELLAEVVGLLTTEQAATRFWVRLIEECWRQKRWAQALDLADQALRAVPGRPGFQPLDLVPLFCLKANFNLALARRAPKQRLEDNRTGPVSFPRDPHHPEFVRPGMQPSPTGPMLKTDYVIRAGMDINEAERIDPKNKVVLDIKAAWCMARIQFSQRAFRPALKTYQEVLRLAPNFLPDPRIGIGLCFWMLGDREKARKAWERSMQVNPNNSSPSAPLLLGLLHLNASKDPLLPGGPASRSAAYGRGLTLIQAAFKKDNTSAGAAAMAPIASHLLLQGGPLAAQNALKLAERMLSFADARLLLAEAHLARARALDADPSTAEFGGALILQSYQRSIEANPDLVMAHLGAGAMCLRMEQYPQAIFAFDTVLRRHPKCIEALVSLAAIHTHLAFTFHAVSDAAGARKSAKEAYEQVLRVFATGKEAVGSGEGGGDRGIAKSERVRVLAEDRDLFIEIAKLWSDEQSVERSLQAYQQAARIEADKAESDIEEREMKAEDDLYATQHSQEEAGPDAVDPRIRNNIGVLLFNRRPLSSSSAANGTNSHLLRAQEQLEAALQKAGEMFGKAGGVLNGGELDAVLTTCTYNLSACYEALGELGKARSGWEQLLSGHREYVDAKARLALLGLKSRAEWDSAHELIKQALTSSPQNAELRALYVYFLFETGAYANARDSARQTLKEVSRHDVYALCASGLLCYFEARENKKQGKEAQRDRVAKFTRAAEFYDKALQLQPQCAFAAQGLAIGIAEGTLGNGPTESNGTAASAAAPGQTAQPLTEQQARLRNARDALGILAKVKESVNEASVYVNIGHCHFARDEYDKAIENYATASRRYLNSKSATVLWYLSRAYYHKAVREQNFSDLQHAIEVGQQATDLHPKDLANLFNMAVLKQKGVEILYALPSEKRTSAELHAAFGHLQASNALFDELAADPTQVPPYEKEVPRQRRSYGRSLESRFPSILETQQAYDETEQGKLEQARRLREAEQKKREEAEAERLAQIQRQAEALAEQRRRMREEAEQWAAMSKEWADSDEDDGKKKRGGGGKKRKSTKMKGGDDEGLAETTSSEGEEKKEKTAKKGKGKAAADGEGSGRMAVDEQYDEDGEEMPVKAPRRRKGKSSGQVKSAEFIEDSDEDE